MALTVKFGNFNSATACEVVSLSLPGAPKRQLSTVSNASADGEAVAGQKTAAIDVKVKYRVRGTSIDPGVLALLFKTSVIDPHGAQLGEQALYISQGDTISNWYYNAWVTEVSTLEYHGYTVAGTVTYHVPVPFLNYRTQTSTTLNRSAGGYQNVSCGLYPGALLEFSGTMTPTDGTVSLTIGSFPFAIELSQAATVAVDFAKRSVTVDGVPALPTIQSEWPEALTGSVRVTVVNGSVNGTLNVRQRRV